MKFIFIILVALLFLTGCNQKTDKNNNKELLTLKPLNQVESLKINTNSKNWIFENFKNKVVIINFFGTWCPPCMKELPNFVNIKEKFKNQLEIIALDVGNKDGSITDIGEINKLIKNKNINFPVIHSTEGTELLVKLSPLNPTGVLPFFVIFNKKGEIVEYLFGYKNEQNIIKIINKYLKE